MSLLRARRRVYRVTFRYRERGEHSVPAKAEDYTLGIEEEYQIIDPETRALCPRAGDVLLRARQALGEDRVVPELRASQLEVLTPVCSTGARGAPPVAPGRHRGRRRGGRPHRRREHPPVLALA